ncbi:MAG: hypothetical protein ABII90_01250, partial [Bacteroidota bacterium]
MKKIKKIFPAFIVSIFIFITCYTTSCDDFTSEEFEISALDAKACQQLQRHDSLGYDTVKTVSLLDFDVKIAVDTSIWVDTLIWVDTAFVDTTILVDTTLVLGWYESVIYAPGNNRYKSVYIPQIIDSLDSVGIDITNTTENKFKIITVADLDTNYIVLKTSLNSLTFFFDRSVSINIINQAGEIISVSNKKMPLETAAGCTKLDDNDVEVPFIQTRMEIRVPDNVSLLQLIKNEQTKSRTI